MRDSVRLRSTPRRACVCVVCSVSVVSVCVLLVFGALHEVSPQWPLPARLPQGRDLGSPLVTHLGHTLPQPLCAQVQDPEPSLSPGLSGNQGRVSRWCQPLPRRPLRQRLLAVPTRAVQTNARGGAHHPFRLSSAGGSHHPFRLSSTGGTHHLSRLNSTSPGGSHDPRGLCSTETRDSRSTWASRSPSTIHLPD